MRYNLDSVSVAFELMKSELDVEIENLNAEGVKEFQSSNYDAAKSLSEKGKELQDFCGRVSALSNEWSERFATEFSSDENEPQVVEATRKILSGSKGPKSLLLVQFPDGTNIFESKAAHTMAAAIKKIGFDRVSKLGINVNNEPIVSGRPSQKYTDTQIEGYFIKTHSNTAAKKRQLDQISDELRLGLQVKIVGP